MARPPFMIVSHMELEFPTSKAHRRRSYEIFKAGGTNHSALAQTLPDIIRQAEREGQSYKLIAHPGAGYFIKAIPNFADPQQPPVVYLRKLHEGTPNEVWAACAKGDPGAVRFEGEI